uniref:Uncharacterized protein MANES_03G009900 n=1 Tax=Rhizophora mucronata TaxID=61149 RepID=A0A2P2LRE6_RHIMU
MLESSSLDLPVLDLTASSFLVLPGPFEAVSMDLPPLLGVRSLFVLPVSSSIFLIDFKSFLGLQSVSLTSFNFRLDFVATLRALLEGPPLQSVLNLTIRYPKNVTIMNPEQKSYSPFRR